MSSIFSHCCVLMDRTFLNCDLHYSLILVPDGLESWAGVMGWQKAHGHVGVKTLDLSMAIPP